MLLTISILAAASSVYLLHLRRSAERNEAIRIFEEHLSFLDLPEVDSFADSLREDQLIFLREHAEDLTPLVLGELKNGNHTAACAASSLGVRQAVPQMRCNLLADRHFYGWEGPDYSTEEAYLRDDQYPHHLAYIRAIEELTNMEITEALALTHEELQNLGEEAALATPSERSCKTRDHFCARWLLSKLTREKEPHDQRPRPTRLRYARMGR